MEPLQCVELSEVSVVNLRASFQMMSVGCTIRSFLLTYDPHFTTRFNEPLCWYAHGGEKIPSLALGYY